MSTSITSSSYFSVSASSNGISGLFSGLDTESMVEDMLSGTQAKIDSQNQLQTQIEWKQDIYQDVISEINDFSGTYFDTSYGSSLASNLASSDFFNTMVSSVTSGSSVTIDSTSSSASTGNMTILVSQLASAASVVSSSRVSGDQLISGSAIDVDSIKSQLEDGEELTLTFSLDGTAKGITFTSDDFTDTEIDADSIYSVLQTKLEQSFGTYISSSMTDDALTFSINLYDSEGASEDGHELTITGASATYFGITPGDSTLVSGSTKLGTIDGIEGNSYSVTINGVDFEFTSDQTVSGMMNTINNSDAGVTISYSSMTDKFTIEASSTGEQYSVAMSQDSGNLLSVLFGSDVVSAASAVSSGTLNTGVVTGTELDDDFTTTSATMTINVNGTDYTFTIDDDDTEYSKSDIESALNTWLDSKFGETDGTANIRYEDGNFVTSGDYLISFDQATKNDTDYDYDLAIEMGFAADGASNAVSDDTEIADVIQFDGLTFYDSEGNEATKLSDIASFKYGETSYDVSCSDGKLSLSGTGTLDITGTELESLFGGSTFEFGDGTMADGAETAGKDAIVTINGIETSRSSNTFIIDGLTLTATSTSDEETVINTQRDTSSIADTIEAFVDDYNSMVEKIYSIITEDDECRDYAPLTDAQKDDMTDDEITEWTAKAKTGLLRSDTYLSSFLSSMRTAMYKSCEKAGIALYSIGIETTEWELSGQLTVDEDALTSAIATNPDAVATLFTDSTDGLSQNLLSICDDYAKLSVASPGSLVALAGADGWSANKTTNELYQQLSDISDKLDDLKDKYDDEKEHYWDEFNSMETAMAEYDSQLSTINSMLGTSSSS